MITRVRSYQSASSVAMARQCELLYAFRYLLGLSDPEIPWGEIAKGKVVKAPWDATPAPGQCSIGQYSRSLGQEIHRLAGVHYGSAESVDWCGLPGQCLASALDCLPKKEERRVEIETPIGFTACEGERVNRIFEFEGTYWAGAIDLLFLSEKWPPLIVDLKSVSDISKYAKSPKELEADLAANLYGRYIMDRFGLSYVRHRWVYMQTAPRKPRVAKPVDFVIDRSTSRKVVGEAAAFVKEKLNHLSFEEAKMSPRSCDKYGGCGMHLDLGGPCQCKKWIRTLP